MANPILGILSGAAGGSNILLQAVGAAMRGESAQSFMSRLANERPELRQINLGDLQGSAQALCQKNGIDPNALAQQIDSVIDPSIKK